MKTWILVLVLLLALGPGCLRVTVGILPGQAPTAQAGDEEILAVLERADAALSDVDRRLLRLESSIAGLESRVRTTERTVTDVREKTQRGVKTAPDPAAISRGIRRTREGGD